MKHITIILLLIVFFSSCINKRKFIHGCYKTEPKFELGSWLCIENDSVFNFKWQYSLFRGETKGIWTVQDNYLILNSYLQPVDTTKDYIIKDKKQNNSDYRTFQLYSPYNNSKLEGASGSIFNDGEVKNSYISNNEGILKIPKEPSDSIVITYVGFKEITVIPDKFDFYSIMMNIYSFDLLVYFSNEKWKINRNSLITSKFFVCDFGEKMKRFRNKNSTNRVDCPAIN